jgi:hypothetical protein
VAGERSYTADMYFGHGSWVVLVLFGVTFAMRYLSSQRRRGPRRGPMSQSSFMGPDRPGPPPPPRTGPVGDGPDSQAGWGSGTGTAPAWYRDPFLVHEHRYWSGTEWTDQVTDNGVAGVDPPPPVSQGHPRS